MTQRNLLTTLGIAALLASSGCTQHYNGSLGVPSSQHRHEANRPASPSGHLNEPDPASAPSHAPEARPGDELAIAVDPVGAATASPGAATRVAAGNVGSMGLFGQLQMTLPDRMSPLDGSGDITRITFTAEGADFDPDVDPTGQRIIYASTRHRETSDLYIKSVHGTAVTQLTNDPANEVMPTFSPDGRRVAFSSDRAGNWDIYVMDAAGGQPVQITSDMTHDIHPSFSPDGKQLVYCSYGAASGQWEIVVVDVENPTTRRVIGLGLFPSWSPVDDRIVFQRARQRGTRWFSVWTVELRDGDVSPPTEIAVSANAAVITPDWSPDGKRIVFCTVIDPAADEHSRPREADVWVVDVDGSNRTKLTEGKFSNVQPVWASDDRIYFVSNRGMEGVENIWAMRPDQAVEVAGTVNEPNTTAAMTR